MVLWIVFAILAAAVTGAVLRPLWSGGEASPVPDSADLAIYRDQLGEIEADRQRGLIDEAEAESARAEVARRILKRSAEDPGQAAAAPGLDLSLLTKALAVSIPLLSLGFYIALGSPELPGEPLASRGAAAGASASVDELVAKVEERLKTHPEDARGWEVIAPVYLRMGRAADAAKAYEQVMRLNGESADLLVGFAQASLMAGNGIVSEAVRKASERALALDANRMEPHLWLGLAKEQDGDLKGAIAGYRALLERPKADGDERWREAVEKRIAMVEARIEGKPLPDETPADAGEAAPSAGPSGPDGPQGAAVAKLPPEQQQQFIEAMVSRLADRLKTNGKDLEGWQKLVRAYQVLGRTDEARAALAEAKKQLADDASAQKTLEDFAASLGLGS